MSCNRTREVLDKKKAKVLKERQAKKEPLSPADVKALLGQVSEVVIAKGKASRRLKPKDVQLDDLKGPTGNFRAPMLISGNTLLVGFAPAELEALLR